MPLATSWGVWIVDLFESDLTPGLEPLKRNTHVKQKTAFDL
jgi:hypothetical protein